MKKSCWNPGINLIVCRQWCFLSGAAAFFTLRADPGTNLGFPLFPVPQSQAFGSNLFHEGPLGAGEGAALGREPPCRAWVSAQPGWNAGRAWGCLLHLRPGLQAGTAGCCLGMRGKLWTLGRFTVVTLWPLLGWTVSSGPPLHLPLLPSQRSKSVGYKAERLMQRSPQHFAKCFPSPPAPIYLGQWPRKAESRELALKCCLKCLLCVFIHLTTHIYVYIWNHLY